MRNCLDKRIDGGHWCGEKGAKTLRLTAPLWIQHHALRGRPRSRHVVARGRRLALHADVFAGNGDESFHLPTAIKVDCVVKVYDSVPVP
jgi:hypothetical protein